MVAAEDAVFGTPEVRIGLWPYMITVPLLRSMPAKTALDLMLTGRRVDAHEGARIGFVQRVVPVDRLDAEVAALAAELRAVGVTMDFAPVADLETNPANPIIKRRSAGSFPEQVAPILSALVQGMQSGGVLATAGLGFQNQSDAPACMECGAIMVRNAACYKCMTCGTTSGCS